MLPESSNGVTGDIIKQTTNLKDYVLLYDLQSVGNRGEVNCWLNCMDTAKCIGYKWDTSGNMCTMYSSMSVLQTAKQATETIQWMCGNSAVVGEICSFTDLITKKKAPLTGPLGTYRFQPDPGCPAYNCEGILYNYMETASPRPITFSPTQSPTQSPTRSPTQSPTQSPTKAPTAATTTQLVSLVRGSSVPPFQEKSTDIRQWPYPQLINGGLRFSGIGASTGNWLAFPTNTIDMKEGFTFVVAFRFARSAAWQRVFDFGNGPGDKNILLTQKEDQAVLRFGVYDSAGTESVCEVPIEFGKVLVAWGWYDATLPGMTLRVDNAGVVSTGQLYAPKMLDKRTLTRNYVGKSNWDGDSYSNMDLFHLQMFNEFINEGPRQTQLIQYAKDEAAAISPGMPVQAPQTSAPTSAPTRAPTSAPTPTYIKFQGDSMNVPFQLLSESSTSQPMYNPRVEIFPPPPQITFNSRDNGTSGNYLKITDPVILDMSKGLTIFTCFWFLGISSLSSNYYQRIFDFGNGPYQSNIILTQVENRNELAFHFLPDAGSNAQWASMSVPVEFVRYVTVGIRYNPTTNVFSMRVERGRTDGEPGSFVENASVNGTMNYGTRVLTRNYIAKSNFPADSYSNVQIPFLEVLNEYYNDAAFLSKMNTTEDIGYEYSKRNRVYPFS